MLNQIHPVHQIAGSWRMMMARCNFIIGDDLVSWKFNGIKQPGTSWPERPFKHQTSGVCQQKPSVSNTRCQLSVFKLWATTMQLHDWLGCGLASHLYCWRFKQLPGTNNITTQYLCQNQNWSCCQCFWRCAGWGIRLSLRSRGPHRSTCQPRANSIRITWDQEMVEWMGQSKDCCRGIAKNSCIWASQPWSTCPSAITTLPTWWEVAQICPVYKCKVQITASFHSTLWVEGIRFNIFHISFRGQQLTLLWCVCDAKYWKI